MHGHWKLPAKPVQVRLLHAKDEVCPTEMSFGNNNTSVWLRAGRPDLIQWKPLKQLLGSKAAKLIPATDKQQLSDAGFYHLNSKHF
jgi:hypothetical protein